MGDVPVKSLDAAVAAGAGTTVDLGESLANHSLSVVSSGGFSATVALEVSHDGVNWLAATTIATSTFNLVQAVRTARYVRANLTIYNGGTVTAYVASC